MITNFNEPKFKIGDKVMSIHCNDDFGYIMKVFPQNDKTPPEYLYLIQFYSTVNFKNTMPESMLCKDNFEIINDYL